MAGSKRRAADTGSASPRKKTSSARPPQRVKPSVEMVEVSSDTDDQPRLSGALRGLNPNNVLATPKPSVEQVDGEDDEHEQSADKENRRVTRGSRNGRTNDRQNYDMKCML